MKNESRSIDEPQSAASSDSIDAAYTPPAAPFRAIEVRIRSATPNDFSYIVEIKRRAFGGPSIDADAGGTWAKSVLSELRQAYRMRHIEIRVAEVLDAPVAYIIARREKGLYEICQIAVLPTVQCRGVGSLLVDDFKRRLSSRKGGRVRILTAVSDGNLPAMFFFKGCGFAAVCELEHSHGGNALRAYEFSVIGWVKDRQKMSGKRGDN